MFEEEINNKLRLSEKIRRELGIVEHSSEDDLLEMDIEELQEKQKIVKRIKEEIASAKLMEDDRSHLMNRVRLIETKINSAIKLWKEIRVAAELEVHERITKVGQPFNVDLILLNKNPFDVAISLEGSWSQGLRQVGTPYPKSLMIKARSSKTINLLLQSTSEGTFIVGPFTIMCKARGMEERITTDSLKVETRALRPALKILKNVNKVRAREGEEIEVTLNVKNEGEGPARNVHLKDDVSGLRVMGGITEWRGELSPGSSQSISYRVAAERPLVLKPAVVSFTDESGRQGFLQSNTISIDVQAVEKPPEILKEEKKAEAPPRIGIDEIISEIGKLGISALIGYSIGSISPKKRKIAKKVVVEEGIRWTAWKQGDQEATLIFEHPIAVAREEHEGFVRLRKATPVEVFHGVDGLTARGLQEQFIHMTRGVLNSWRPEGATDVSMEEYPDTGAYERIRSILKEYGEEVDEKKLNMLPRNPTLICTYRAKRGFLRKETLMKVYVKTYADIEKLYFDEVDHTQMSLSHPEVSSLIKSLSQLEHPVIIFICSPTGWNEETKRFAREASDPKTHLVFMDLKTLDAYFNDRKNILKELYSLMPKVEATYPEEAGEELEKLDNLLLNGTLTLERYIEEVKKLWLRGATKEVAKG
jgi:uncharacterized repeat protein (TIGR01451 family)